MWPLGGTVVSPSGYISQPPSGAGVTLKSPGTRHGVPSGIVNGFQSFCFRAEHRLARQHADDVNAQRLAQRIIHLTQHLVRLDYPDALVRLAQQPLAQSGHRRDMDARDGRGAEIHARGRVE